MLTAGVSFGDIGNERYLFLTLHFAMMFAVIIHFFLIFAATILGITTFVVINGISIVLYASLIFLLRKYKTYRLSGIVMAFEVVVFALLATVYIGEGCYFFLYFFLLLLMQTNIPYAKTAVRFIISAVILAAVIAAIILEHSVEPIYYLQSENALLAISVSNCVLCFFGVLIELVAIDMLSKDNIERVQEYEKQAHTDSLTGIYNRWYADGFLLNIAKETSRGEYCVAIMDIDNFKKINDTYGHLAGDDVLRELGSLLKNSFRKTDVIFRWGGEEFLVFLCDVDLRAAANILDTVCKRISETTVVTGSAHINFTVTIGVSSVDVHDVKGSIAICDERLYWGKQNGKNKVVC